MSDAGVGDAAHGEPASDGRWRDSLLFLATNRIPRRALTVAYARLSRIDSPTLVRLILWIWERVGGDLRLDEARERSFRTLNDCFIRQLREGARPVDQDPQVLVSPCDAVVGASGRIDEGRVLQAKGMPYSLGELLGDEDLAGRCRDGLFVTLRLRSCFYHRFHAPDDCDVARLRYIAGDVWNVHPPALARVSGLFCRNERAVLECELHDGLRLILVPVAAILVASLRLRWLPQPLDLRYGGPTELPGCDGVTRGEELGYFQHGSTIVLLAPPGVSLCDSVTEGATVRVGEPLLRRDPAG